MGETAGDGGVAYGIPGVLNTADLLAASGPGVDAFSYHHYGASSIRCAAVGPQTQTTADAALSEKWLAKTDETLAFYSPLRDKFEPGKPFWNTETADAACGGNPWGGTFLDTFRYLDHSGGSRNRTSGLSLTTHSSQATTACWRRKRLHRSQTTGRR